MSYEDIHIKSAKFDYEYLGKSRAQIASDYGFPLVSLSEEIEDRGWGRKLAPTELPTTTDMQKFADQLEKITRSKLSIISLFRQIDNQSLYAQLEKAILASCLSQVEELSSMDDKAAQKLMNITKTLASIQERDPVQLADLVKEAVAAEGKGGAAAVVVNIANQIQ